MPARIAYVVLLLSVMLFFRLQLCYRPTRLSCATGVAPEWAEVVVHVQVRVCYMGPTRSSSDGRDVAVSPKYTRDVPMCACYACPASRSEQQ